MSGPRRVRGLGPVAAAVAAALVVLGCTATGPILANPTVPRPAPPSPSATPARPADPVPIVLPRDDRPHDRLTEWWYYTGHLADGSGGRWGFEFVIFRAERGGFPVSWASHLALTDERAGTFRYDQRTEIGPQIDQSAASGDGYRLAIRGLELGGGGSSTGAAARGGATSRPPTAGATTAIPWLMSGLADRHHLGAASPGARFGFDLDLVETRPVALHDRDGWVDFGPAGGSYYYSRTRMNVLGGLQTGSGLVAVQGLAWFDHQWGDFIAVGGGGWDWFAVNLEDGTDLTFSLVRAADGSYPLVYGTLVADGPSVRHLERDDFTIVATRTWVSPRTGATYPAGWRIEVPSEELTIDLRPTVADQELDTRPTSGVVYWEGSQVVEARRGGRSLGGQAYVELTGYDPAVPAPGGSAPGSR